MENQFTEKEKKIFDTILNNYLKYSRNKEEKEYFSASDLKETVISYLGQKFIDKAIENLSENGKNIVEKTQILRKHKF